MNLAAQPYRVIETVDRRVMGAFALVDALTGLPVTAAASVEVRGASIGNEDVPLRRDSAMVRQNGRGLFVISRAPYFDDYSAMFLDPQPPEQTADNPLRLRIGVTDAGPSHLPQEFTVDLPRAAVDLQTPVEVPLYRAPNASAQMGWTQLRTRVTRKGSNPVEALPGVRVRVYRRPHANADAPIGEGMTEWRGTVMGEALVALTGVLRFRPGEGANVVETEQAIEFLVTRDSQFTGAAGQLPNIGRMPSDTQPDLVQPAAAFSVRSGREYVVHLAMP